MTDLPNAPSRGLVAGKYALLREIGRGAMGSVWEARHASLATRVAVKFIDAGRANSPEARRRFENEARAVATIESKHALQVFDHGVTDEGLPYIVMELLQGESLEARINRQGRISLAETARILGQVCRALQRAHDLGIVHRDLKPDNIFVVRAADDEAEIAKVLDFGIAKLRPGLGGLDAGTRTGAVLGTPYYMSPEQLRDAKEVDARTDLWSMGVIAFRCATGVVPFQGSSLADLFLRIEAAPLPQPSLVVPGIPPAFDAWMARALQRDPSRRFGSARELADALSAAAGMPARGARANVPEAHAPTFAASNPTSNPTGPSPASPPMNVAALSSPALSHTASPPGRSSRTVALLLIAGSLAVVGGVVALLKLTTATESAPRSGTAPTLAETRSAEEARSEPTPAMQGQAPSLPSLAARHERLEATRSTPAQSAPRPPPAAPPSASPSIVVPPPPAASTAPPAASPTPETAKPTPKRGDPGY